MRMRLCYAVKTFFLANHSQRKRLSLFAENIQVPVYSPQRKVGNSGFKLFINPLCPRMDPGGTEQGKDSFPFDASFSVIHILIIITIIDIVK
jgi:hypothetical protein